jgi:hypothetical protein
VKCIFTSYSAKRFKTNFVFLISDQSFYPANFINDLVWVGMSGSFGRYFPEERTWYIYQQGTGIYATSNASSNSLLMGKDLHLLLK